MKTKSIALFVMLLIASVHVACAADNVNEALQKGLLEEEPNRNLDAAIQAYQSVINQFDNQRKIAATAVFRLGECYRKLGKTNEAVAQYQRVVQDFADQAALTPLSRQNLLALGAFSQIASKSGEGAPTTAEELIEIQRLQGIIKNSPDLIYAKDSLGNTPLHKAASKGHPKVARFLLVQQETLRLCRRTPEV